MPFLEDITAACRSVPNIRRFWSNRAAWQTQFADDFAAASTVYADLTRAATRFGENLLALEIALEGRDTLSAFRASRPVLAEQKQLPFPAWARSARRARRCWVSTRKDRRTLLF